MLSRRDFTRRFGPRPLFAMIHLAPLPGSPEYGGSMDEVIELAVRDARTIAAAGADGIVVENFGDRPFSKTVGPVTVAAMTRAIAAVAAESELPIGVNVLRNDPQSALGIAAAVGAAFIRVNVHTGAMLTDQGVIEGEAAATLRTRAAIAPDVAVFADWMVKHAVPLAGVDPDQAAVDLRERGRADAVIVSGRATGDAAEPGSLERLRRLIPEAPLMLGSGLTARNASRFAAADGAIVGTSVKRGGDVDAPVDRRRLFALIAAWKRSV